MTETADTAAPTRPAKGLTIERIFTTEGVHPYDAVTWESRDVVQQNWKTGETIFEQRGVEFPDFWSVNASTIVTTKYFRGAVGTPERETGLKQLIDRVVLTYTKAGKDNGFEVFNNAQDHILAAAKADIDLRIFEAFKEGLEAMPEGEARELMAKVFDLYALASIEEDKGWFIEHGRITARQIESARRVITRYVKRGGKLWIRIFPDVPVTKKPLEVRMGSGKGNVEYWVAKVQPGKMLYEIEGVTEAEAQEAFRLAAAKLSVKTTFANRTVL